MAITVPVRKRTLIRYPARGGLRERSSLYSGKSKLQKLLKVFQAMSLI
ncbi:MAG TPA: hypothetical protein VF553_16510 [Pyrinomonadaceae bacterium]|jgi:hypothetical protein